jgi:hypothetical protein
MKRTPWQEFLHRLSHWSRARTLRVMWGSGVLFVLTLAFLFSCRLMLIVPSDNLKALALAIIIGISFLTMLLHWHLYGEGPTEIPSQDSEPPRSS